MASEESPERSNRPPEMIVMSITVKQPSSPHGRPLREALARITVTHRTVSAVATLAVAALAATFIAGPRGGEPRRSAIAHPAAYLPLSQREAIAGELGYPYPLRCLTITVSAVSPDYARADVDRTDGCNQYNGYVNASLHRVDGAWRLVLDEGQLFVPNTLLSPCGPDCGRPAGRVAGGRSRTVGAGAVGTAYLFPLGCLSVAVALHDPRFTRAAFDRAICARRRPADTTSL